MNRLAVAARAVGLGVVLASPLSCRQVVGIGSSPETHLTTSVCGLPFGTPSCASCAMANCCGEATACAADPTCAPYGACMGQCKGDPRCWAQCAEDRPADTPPVSALSACMAGACESDCGLTCGGFAGQAIPPDAADSCQACLLSSACSAERACATSSDCDAIGRCQALCATLDCAQACEFAHGVDPGFAYELDGGSGGAFATLHGAVTQCADRCAVGSDWRCVGHVSWPPIHAAAATYHFWLKDNATGTPVAGAQVTLCSDGDAPCAMPLGGALTNEAGFGSWSFQNAFGITGASVGLFGYLHITAPTLSDYYIYLGFPLSEAQVYSYGLATTPDELQASLTAFQATQGLDRGMLTVAVYDCGFNPAAGVQVTLDEADTRTSAYTVTGGRTNITDKVGLVFFYDVPPGNVHVKTTPTAIAKPSGALSLNVRKAAITVAIVVPTP